MNRATRLVLLIAAGASSAATSAHATTTCSGMALFGHQGVVVNSATEVSGTLPADDLVRAVNVGEPSVDNLPRFCRVIATLRPVAGSRILLQVWLPEQWNGKLLGIGNHGFGGDFHHNYMAMGLNRGYAVAMSDVGTGGTVAPQIRADFPVGNAIRVSESREAVEDFAWRATHEMTVVAKAMIRARYGEPARRAYFNGCSNGGRQAIREAQQFPEDYDGVIAGSAGLYWSRFMASDLLHYRELVGAGLTLAKLKLAQNAAVAACDRDDGLSDGLINDPRQCRWTPSELSCKSGDDPATCLTEREATAIAHAQSPMTDPKSGKTIFGGWYPGGESLWAPRGAPQFPGTPLSHFRYVVTRDPGWTPENADPFALLAISEKPGAASLSINTVNPDLSAFRRRGGKVIQYHGWNDPAMAPSWYPQFYVAVADLQPGADKLSSAQQFYRLFMVPGMAHCRGGDGPVNFGGLSHPASPVVNADHDVLEALDRWVEKGIAPDRLIATQFAPDGKVRRQMTLCPFPQSAIYVSGEANSASSFQCRAR